MQGQTLGNLVAKLSPPGSDKRAIPGTIPVLPTRGHFFDPAP